MILRQAITHIPLSQYAFANSETNITIRIRAARGNLTHATLYYGDRVQPGDPIIFSPVPMKIIASDREFDYFDATFETPYPRVCYYFRVESGEEGLFLYADIFSETLPDERSEFYQYPFILRSEISTVPDWLKHAVVYNIFPDSFADGYRRIAAEGREMGWNPPVTLRSRLGGTIRGILDNLDYIQELGFNCLYLNPFFTAGEYHKYDLLDYYHVSKDRGRDEDFKELVEKAHQRGIRVVIDGVFNHCSWYFFAFDDVVLKGEASQYKDWFYELHFPVVRPEREDVRPGYGCFAYERKMPKLNTANPEVQEYFADVCRYWIREFHVDGWRLDVANEVDKNFWRSFKQAGREIDPDSVMIGEIWESSEVWLHGDMFDSTMNYDFRKNCRDFFGRGRIKAPEFNVRVNQMNMRYPTGILQGQLNLLDSHDVSRFLSCCQGDIRRFRLAEIFLFTAPGVPCVFYGDELGMEGDHEFALRGKMPWEEPPHDERDFFRRLIHLRKSCPALVYGSFQAVEMNSEGLYVFRRQWKEEAVTVALNAGEEGAVLEHLPKQKLRWALGLSDTGRELAGLGYAVWV